MATLIVNQHTIDDQEVFARERRTGGCQICSAGDVGDDVLVLSTLADASISKLPSSVRVIQVVLAANAVTMRIFFDLEFETDSY